MCGIVGYISNHKRTDIANGLRSYMYQSLYVDSLRGRDSTGVFSVDNLNHKVNHYKRPVEATDFLQLPKTRAILDGTIMSSVMIGHNRAATVGRTTAANAHPFEHDHIIGVHNGTLKSRNGLRDKKDFEVDSDNIFYTFSKDNPSDIIPQIDGAFSLIWYDSNQKLLHIIRNDERTLFYGKMKDTDTYLIASESGMLEWLAKRSGFEPENISPFKVGVEYTFNPEDPINFSEKKHKLYVPPKTEFYRADGNFNSLPKTTSKPKDNNNPPLKSMGVNYGQKYCFYVSDFKQYKGSDKGAMIGWMTESPFCKAIIHRVSKKDYDSIYSGTYQTGKALSIQVKDNYNVVVFDISPIDNNALDLYNGPHGKKVNKESWLRLVKDGCSMCSADLLPQDHKDVFWNHNGDPFCDMCYVDPNTLRIKG